MQKGICNGRWEYVNNIYSIGGGRAISWSVFVFKNQISKRIPLQGMISRYQISKFDKKEKVNTQEHANWRDIRDGIVMGWAMRRRNGTNDERNQKILTVNRLIYNRYTPPMRQGLQARCVFIPAGLFLYTKSKLLYNINYERLK